MLNMFLHEIKLIDTKTPQRETTPMRRFKIDHLIDVNKKVIYAITDITL